MTTFNHSFSKQYWITSAKEVKNTFSLIVCALFTALRIAVKSLRINIAPSLYLTFDFIVNSVGAMVYGPILGLIGGAVSDTVGCLLFPSGAYFFPYIFIEMSSAFIFGLFLYRKKLSAWRIITARFSVIAVCNLLLTPTVMYWEALWNGTEASYNLLSTARIIKNVALFPAESLVMLLILPAIALPLSRKGYVPSVSHVKIRAREIVLIVLLTILSATFVILYIMYKNGAFNI